MKAKIIRGEYEMEESLSGEAQDLIRSILRLEPTERLTLKQILQHPWFTIKDEEEDDDDDWDTTDEVVDSESPSSVEENNVGGSGDTTSHLEYLERQRREIFLTTNQQGGQSHQSTSNTENGMTTAAPSAFELRLRGMTSASTNTVPPNVWGPSTSRSSRRSSVDSKAFNEKIFFTTPEEKELLEKLDDLGFDIQAIKHSVLEGKVDSSCGLWWLQLTKLREKRRIEGTQSSITMVDVAVGTSDDEVELVDDIDEELDDAESPEENNGLPRSSHEGEGTKVKDNIEILEEIMPPTPPPKTYHSAPASRERRKSLILSFPEAVEPVLTTITATASPPLSPKKYSSFTSPLSSRSKGGIFSALKGWWVGANHHKDSGSYKKNILGWAESRVVAPTDVARTRSRINRRSGSKTPPNYDANLQRSSSVSRGSIKDRKKKNRNSLQGSKGRRHNIPPLIIPPVTPSIVLSQNSPTSMLPIPGTPPAVRSKTMFTINRRNPFAYPGSSWGRKQVKRRSTGGSSINQFVENFNSTNESGSSENNNNNKCKKDTFEKSTITDIRADAKNTEMLESAKEKIVPPKDDGSSSLKISEESLAPSDDGEESDVFVDAANNNDETTPSTVRGSNDQLLRSRSTDTLLSEAKGKNPGTNASPIERPQLQSVLNFMSTPPDSPKMSQSPFPSTHPVPSKSSQLRQLQHNRTHSSPSVLRNVGKGISDNSNDTENIGINIPNRMKGREITGSELRRDSSPSPPNVSVLNGAQRLFVQNNAMNSRRSLQNGLPRKSMMSMVGNDINVNNVNANEKISEERSQRLDLLHDYGSDNEINKGSGESFEDVERPWKYKIVALLCALSLAVGSHYAAHTLGALKAVIKEELGITNAQYGIVQSSVSLVNTILPILGGVFIDTFGTMTGSILATSLIALGNVLVALSTTLVSFSVMVFASFLCIISLAINIIYVFIMRVINEKLCEREMMKLKQKRSFNPRTLLFLPAIYWIVVLLEFALGPVSLLSSIPLLLPLSYVGTGLGIVKSVSNVGATLYDILVGILQDEDHGRYTLVMRLYLITSLVAMLISIWLSMVTRKWYDGVLDMKDDERKYYFEEKKRNEDDVESRMQQKRRAEPGLILVSSNPRSSYNRSSFAFVGWVLA
ncbi:11829_t:CDS:10 [Acaulospora colombiana]|uniref:11829_t:CDS:1 n=1 Tax=Acaulospora colombiana TaxID=27376 RepID=A0ACA9K6Z0_9GLOM|nr:11829_t:CDS:10 [Acaulospora colombiana]